MGTWLGASVMVSCGGKINNLNAYYYTTLCLIRPNQLHLEEELIIDVSEAVRLR